MKTLKMINQLLDNLLPPKIWAVLGQLNLISILVFVSALDYMETFKITELYAGWLIAGVGIFLGALATHKASN